MEIYNTNNGTLISESAENDSINNTGASVTIEAFGGDDLVKVPNASNVLVNSGDGDDVVSTVPEYSTLTSQEAVTCRL